MLQYNRKCLSTLLLNFKVKLFCDYFKNKNEMDEV